MGWSYRNDEVTLIHPGTGSRDTRVGEGLQIEENELQADSAAAVVVRSRAGESDQYATLALATAAMSAGDTLYLGPGLYTETLSPKEQAWNILSVARAADIVTVVTNEEHGLSVGDLIEHYGIDTLAAPVTTFDGTFIVASVVDAFTYTVLQDGEAEDSDDGGGLGAAYMFYDLAAGAVIAPASGLPAIDMYQGALGGYGAAIISGAGVFISTNYQTVQANINVLNLVGHSLRERNTDGTAAACLNVSGFVKLQVEMTNSIVSDSYDALLGTCNPSCHIESPLIMGGANPSAAAAASCNGIEVNAPLTGTAVIKAGRIVSLTGAAVNLATDIDYGGRLIIRSASIEGKSAGVAIGGSASASQIVDIEATWITASAGPGVSDAGITDDIVRIHGARIESTYDHANGFAVVKTGTTATLVLDNCTLVPHATSSESINTGGNARTVICFGSKTAVAIGTATVATGLTVDAAVL